MLINVSNNSRQVFFSNNFIINKASHRVVKTEDGLLVFRRYSDNSGDIPIGDMDWIFTTGFWNDDGEWKDEDFIEDYGLTKQNLVLDGSTTYYIENSGNINDYELSLDFFVDKNTSGYNSFIHKGLDKTNISNSELYLGIYKDPNTKKESIWFYIQGRQIFSGDPLDNKSELYYNIKTNNWNNINIKVKLIEGGFYYKIILNKESVIEDTVITANLKTGTGNFEFSNNITSSFKKAIGKIGNILLKDLKNEKTYTYDLEKIENDILYPIERKELRLLKLTGTTTLIQEDNYFYGKEPIKPLSENEEYVEPEDRYVFNPRGDSTAQYNYCEIAKEYFNPKRHFKIEFDFFSLNIDNQILFQKSFNNIDRTGTDQTPNYKEIQISLNSDILKIVFNKISYNYTGGVNVYLSNYLNQGNWNNISIEIEVKTNTTFELTVYCNGFFILKNNYVKSELIEVKKPLYLGSEYINSSSYYKGYSQYIANIKLYDFDKDIEGDKFRLDENGLKFFSNKSYRKRFDRFLKGLNNIDLIQNPFLPKEAKEETIIEPEFRNALKFTNVNAQRATLNSCYFNMANNFKIKGMFFLKETSKGIQTIFSNSNFTNYYFRLFKNNTTLDFTLLNTTTRVLTPDFIFNGWNSFELKVEKITDTSSYLSIKINGIDKEVNKVITHLSRLTNHLNGVNIILGGNNDTSAFEDKLINFEFEDLTENKKLTFRLDEPDNLSSYRCPEDINAVIYKAYTSTNTGITTENILNPLFI